MRTTIAENLCNLGVQWIIEIYLILHSTHLVFRIKTKWYFTSLIIMIRISLANDITLIRLKKVYKL